MKTPSWFLLLSIVSGCNSAVVFSDEDGVRFQAVSADVLSIERSVFFLRDHTEAGLPFCSATLVGARTLLTTAECASRSSRLVAGNASMVTDGMPRQSGEIEVVGVDFLKASDPVSEAVEAPKTLALVLLNENPSEAARLALSAALPAALDAVPVDAWAYGVDGRHGKGNEPDKFARKVVPGIVVETLQDAFRYAAVNDTGPEDCEGASGGPSVLSTLEGPVLLGIHDSKYDVQFPQCQVDRLMTPAVVEWVVEGTQRLEDSQLPSAPVFLSALRSRNAVTLSWQSFDHVTLKVERASVDANNQINSEWKVEASFDDFRGGTTLYNQPRAAIYRLKAINAFGERISEAVIPK